MRHSTSTTPAAAAAMTTATAFVLLVASALCVSVAAQAQTPARPVRTICSIPAADLTPAALHVKHTVEYYASRFTNVEFRHRLLGNGQLNTRNYVSSWVINGSTGCSAMVGPGFSFLAIAMSPVIDGPWMDFSATSVELSDKAQHPFFSRIIPTDEVGAKAASAAMIRFGWKQISIFCVDDAYGRSVAGGVSADLIRAGGGVDVQRCLPATTTRERVEAALDDIAQGSSRVVFGAMLPTQQTYQLFVQVARERQLYDKLIFFFSEAMCSLSDRSYATLSGSLCATYSMNPAIVDPFMATYWQRNVPLINAELRSMGLTDDPLLSNVTDIYAQLAHDAAFHVMSGMDAYVAAGGRAATNLDEYLYIRQHVSVGGTGRIELDANGDRITADALIINAQANSVEVNVGRVIAGNFTFLNNAASLPLYLLGETYDGEYPVAVIAAPGDSEKADNTVIYAVVSVLLVIILGGAIAMVVMKLTQEKTRDNSAAPKEDGRPFSIVFTDIQSSTALWANAPMETSEAIEVHHEVIRKQIAKHKGYEVKTIGDAFMVAFIDPKNALAFSLACQVKLWEADWGEGTADAVDRIYRESLLEKHPNDHPTYVQRDIYDEVWAGIRVRIGIHFGLGDIKFDEVSLGYDYYGTVVNTAARVEAVGHGGQVCCTEEFVTEFGGMEKLQKECTVVDLGEVQLRGLKSQTHLIQCVPEVLDRRVFPPLRLEVDVEDDEGEDEADSIIGSTASSAVSAMFGGDGEGAHQIESAAYKHAKRFGLNGPTAVGFARRCADYHALVSTMLSTSKPQKKAQLLMHIAVKWRLAVSDEKALLDKRKFDDILVAVIAKSIRAMDKQAQQHGGGHTLTQHALPQGVNPQRRRSSIMKQMVTQSPSGNFVAMPKNAFSDDTNTSPNHPLPGGPPTRGSATRSMSPQQGGGIHAAPPALPTPGTTDPDGLRVTDATPEP